LWQHVIVGRSSSSLTLPGPRPFVVMPFLVRQAAYGWNLNDLINSADTDELASHEPTNN
jgi:hypothetical protein